MKKIIFILFFITASFYAQPPINQPSQLATCQVSSAYGLFDLTSKNSEILGSLDPGLFTVNYYESFPDSQNGINPIQNPTQYVSVIGYQTVFVRVFENLNPSNFALVYLQLQLYYLPYIQQSPNMTVYESPNDGIATFNLNLQTPLFIGSQQDVLVTFYTSETDALNEINQLPNTTSYTNISNPQTIFARVENSITGCSTIVDFQLIVISDGIVVIPDTNFKAKLLAANENNNIASNVNPNSSATLNVYTKVDTNQDGEIQFSEAQSIIYLNVSGLGVSVNGGIQNLQGIEAFYNLITFFCNYNQLNSIDLSVLPNIRNFYCTHNNATSLNLTNANKLRIIDCSYNQFTNLNFEDCINLTSLSARNNQLTVMDLSANNSIERIFIPYNNLTSFELSNKNFLRTLEVGFNQLTSIQLSNLPILYRVKVQNNNLTNIDLSSVAFQVEPNNLPSANVFDVGLNNNLNLNVINLKNGFTNNDVSFFSGNLNGLQQYICIDESDGFSFFGTTPNPILGTYCSFTPGGNYNTITGTILFDADQNGCNANDLSNPNIRIDINDGTNQGATFTDNSGVYNFYTSAGSFVLNLNVENPSWFTISPTTATIPFANNINNTTIQNFCVTANGVHSDVEMVIEPVTPARPGFDAVYKLVYKNNGNQTETLFANFGFDGTRLQYVSSSAVPYGSSSNSLAWQINNVMPFQSGSILVTLHVNSPTDTPAVNIGDGLAFTSFIDVTTDENWTDNAFDYNQIVVGAFDPNDITCLQGDIVSPTEIGAYLHYMIRFENTGTFEAENIVVRTEVNAADFDINSLQLMNASHPVYARINGNTVEFIFQNILLESGGHGNVLLKVKSKSNLQQGDAVNKKANIYFDYNYPVETNEAQTVFQALSNPDFEVDNSISIYPNPSDGIVNIKGDFNIKSTELFDIQGRLLQTNIINDTTTVIDLSSQSSGVYFVKVITEKGIKVDKIVKQ
ncbi:T9SS type A sorting domain-containing protein [Flavobacterium sp.]|uniref:DUF7619 domain-containing protein n=1 Tax=Flavobacterium sp. TaxID=239 RepID=UPI003918F7B6